MLDIGWTELLVIAVVLIVVVGPKDLPPMLRAFGKMTGNLRKMASDFRTQFDQALREADMDDVRQTISDVQKFHPANAIREAINPLREMGNEIRNDLQRSTTLPVSSGAETADGTGDLAPSSTASVEGLLPAASLGLPEASLPAQPPAALAQPAATVASATQQSQVPQAKTSARKASGKAAKVAGADLQTTKVPARKRVTKAASDRVVPETVPAKPKPARKAAAPKAAATTPADNPAPVVAAEQKPRKKPARAQVKAPKQVDVPKDEA